MMLENFFYFSKLYFLVNVALRRNNRKVNFCIPLYSYIVRRISWNQKHDIWKLFTVRQSNKFMF